MDPCTSAPHPCTLATHPCTSVVNNGVTRYKYFKQGISLILWGLFTYILVLKQNEHEKAVHQIYVSEGKGSFRMMGKREMRKMTVDIGRDIGGSLPAYNGNSSEYCAVIWVEIVQKINSTLVSDDYVISSQNISDTWNDTWTVHINSKNVPESKRSHTFMLNSKKMKTNNSFIRLQVRTNLSKTFTMPLSYDTSSIAPGVGIVYALPILIGLNVMIIFDVVHRTLAAIIAAMMSIAALAAFDERPSQSELVAWIDTETLLLLFSMMILVSIFNQTGVFDYLATHIIGAARGKWQLITSLCVATAVISAFVDGVTTILLFTPLAIKLCRVKDLNPAPVLMIMVMYSNIGGAMTPMGDPANVLIYLQGVTFGVFTIHMTIGLVIVMFFVYGLLRFLFRNPRDLLLIEPNGRVTVENHSEESQLLNSVESNVNVQEAENNGNVQVAVSNDNVQEAVRHLTITDQPLLVKCLITFFFLVLLFMFQSKHVGWDAFLAAIFILILSDNHSIERIFLQVEWATLVFFTALFILMGALSKLGLIEFIGKWTESIIQYVHKDHQLTVAIFAIFLVSGFASAFIDNIPLTTMMIRIITSLSQNKELGLPLGPLVWSLVFGACLGGNGTLIGASSNIVCSGIAEQKGCGFTFMEFLRIGLPVTIVSMIVAACYLYVCHVIFAWNYS